MAHDAPAHIACSCSHLALTLIDNISILHVKSRFIDDDDSSSIIILCIDQLDYPHKESEA